MKAEIPEFCRRMNREGLNQGTSGNISVRTGDRFWITPSGTPYDNLAEEDLVSVGLDGTFEGNPSSEWRFHQAVYRERSDAKAIVHTHSAHATALSCFRKPIPSFHYMVAIAGVIEIPCAPYETFGTQALADGIAAELRVGRACLIANHGQIALGGNLEQAYGLAVEVEILAQQYLLALSVGEPTILPPEEMAVVLKKFETYGKGN